MSTSPAHTPTLAQRTTTHTAKQSKGNKAGKRDTKPSVEAMLLVADVAALPLSASRGKFLKTVHQVMGNQKFTARDEDLPDWKAFLLALASRLKLAPKQARELKKELQAFLKYWRFQLGETTIVENLFEQKKAEYFQVKQAREDKRNAKQKNDMYEAKYYELVQSIMNSGIPIDKVKSILSNSDNAGFFIDAAESPSEPETPPPCEPYSPPYRATPELVTPEGTPEPCEQSPPGSYGGHTSDNEW